jgi:hypothetical protein
MQDLKTVLDEAGEKKRESRQWKEEAATGENVFWNKNGKPAELNQRFRRP